MTTGVGKLVDLIDLRCPGCRCLLGMVHLPAGAVIQIKCAKCNAVRTVGGGGATVTMLTRTRAEISDRRDAA